MNDENLNKFENNQHTKEFDEIYSLSSFEKDESNEIFSSTEGKEHYYRSEKNKNKKQKKGRKKRKSLKKFLITITAVLLVLAIALGGGLYYVKKNFDYKHNDIDATNSELGFESQISKKIINVALFGVDTRNTEVISGNSDSIMILSLNTKTKKIKVISVLRDSLVEIENNGKTSYRKINSAYALGGPELAIKTLNRNFSLDISEYATVSFFGMAEIIESIGGIEAELTEREVLPRESGVKALNECIYGICVELGVDPTPYYITTPGKQHLNGIQAVAYSRIRYVPNIWGTNDDYGRTERQRYVMEQLFNAVKTIPKSKYLGLIKALVPCTETSLGVDEIFNIAVNMMFGSPTFEQSRVPLDEYKMRSIHKIPAAGSYVYYDKDYASDVLHAFIYDDIPTATYMEQNPVRTNDWYGNING